jgi:hypothetical protein
MMKIFRALSRSSIGGGSRKAAKAALAHLSDLSSSPIPILLQSSPGSTFLA